MEISGYLRLLDSSVNPNILAANIYNELQSYDIRLEEPIDFISINFKPFKK